MSTSYQVIGVGNPIMDYLCAVEESFLSHVSGEKGGMELVDAPTIDALIAKLPSTITTAPGGAAANTTFGLARLGVKSTYLGKVGNDSTAHLYLEQFSKLGGDTSRFKKGSIPNGRCLSLVTPDSERTMRTDLGAAVTLDPEEISPADFAGCKHAHIEGYLLFNEALFRKIVTSAKAAGCTISLDLASFEVIRACKDIILEILADYVDLAFANEDEAKELFGHEDDADNLLALSKLCSCAVVKLGKDGSLIHHEQTTYVIPPILADKVVDTTAAGDLWATGFLYGWLRGKPIKDCGYNGSLIGCLSVQSMGSTIPDDMWEKYVGQLK